MIRGSVPISRTEVPPDEEPAYCPRPLYQYKPYQSSQARSDYHVTRCSLTSRTAGCTHVQPLRQLGPVPATAPTALCVTWTPRHAAAAPHRSAGPRPGLPRPRLQGKNVYAFAVRPRARPAWPATSRPMTTAWSTCSPVATRTLRLWDLEDLEKYRLQRSAGEPCAAEGQGACQTQYDNMSSGRSAG